MDYEQSKKYNEDNYVFAGFDYSEEVPIVNYRDNRKPTLLDPNDKCECNMDYLLQLSNNSDEPTSNVILEFILTYLQIFQRLYNFFP